mgnify:FL=1
MEEQHHSSSTKTTQTEVAFEAFYATTYQPLFRYVFSRLRERDVAEDIVQKSFVSLWRVTREEPRALTEPYLFTIARNAIIDYFRKKKEILFSPEDPKWQALPTDNASPLEEHVAREERSTLEESLRMLPPSEGEALRLKFFADRTTKEVSQILNTSEANVRQLQCRGLKHLRKQLIVNAHL